MPSVDWSTESLPCDRGIITNKHNTHRYFWTMAKALFSEENVAQFAVLLGIPTLLLFVHCARSPFSLDLLSGYTVSGCYEITILS